MDRGSKYIKYIEPLIHVIFNPYPWYIDPLPMVYLPLYSREALTTSQTYPWSFDHIFSIAVNQVMVATLELSK
jgi:hypothetical protein